MNKPKRLKQPKCECGAATADGSVYCVSCRAAVKKRNNKLLGRKEAQFAKRKKK